MLKSLLLLIRSLLWLGAGLFLVIFAVNNRAGVAVSLEPFSTQLVVPIWSLLFAGIFTGLMITGLVTASLRLKGFVRRRQAERKAAELKKEVAGIAEDAHQMQAARAHSAASETTTLAKNGR